LQKGFEGAAAADDVMGMLTIQRGSVWKLGVRVVALVATEAGEQVARYYGNVLVCLEAANGDI
jgi:hypothetical protein